MRGGDCHRRGAHRTAFRSYHTEAVTRRTLPRGHRTGARGKRTVLTTSSPQNRSSSLGSRRAPHPRRASCASDRSVHRTVQRGRRSTRRDHSTTCIVHSTGCRVHCTPGAVHFAGRRAHRTEVGGHSAGTRSHRTRRAGLRNRRLCEDQHFSTAAAPVLAVSVAKQPGIALPPPVVASDSLAIASVAIVTARASSSRDCRHRSRALRRLPVHPSTRPPVHPSTRPPVHPSTGQ